MTLTQLNALSYEEKLLLGEPDSPKVAEFITCYGSLRHITIYAVENFYTELVFDLSKRKVEAINAFETVDYLDRYRGFMKNIEGKIRGLKNNIHPFNL